MKDQKWIPVEKKLPRSGREVMVLCSDGVITRAHCVHWRDRRFAGWVYDLFAVPSKDARPLMWRKIEVEKAEVAL